MQFSRKLFREADQLSLKITSQIEECQLVREGMRHEIRETNRMLEEYQSEESKFTSEIQKCKALYHKSRYQYNDIVETHQMQFKRKGTGTGGQGIRNVAASPYIDEGRELPKRQGKNFLVRTQI
jgi:hypothetical protein